MASTRELLDAVKLRAWSLVIGSRGEISFAEASRAAAQEIAAQERARKRSLASQSSAAAQPSMEGVTPSNARKWLYARLSEIASRLKASASLDEPPPIRKHTQDEIASTSMKHEVAAPPVAPKPEPEQPVADQIIGGVVFGTTTAQRIDPSEFAPSLRWGDRATDNWRRSIETNERIAKEKAQRSRWIG
jgi:hypothetical protein